MELTRRDAVAALGALGVGGTLSGCVAPPGAEPLDVDRIREVLVAAAEVVYPSEVTGTATFVESFLEGRLEDPTHAAGLDEAVADLDEHAAVWFDESFAALSIEDRDRALRGIGAADADENPDGTTAERVRYYVVNDLLLALYASPAGGELVGIENPQGHAGGLDSYQRGPGA
ncbi:gluconate 2-dehydrogenase subunit 3 family protein [Haloterrigena alkaliphila]|uniref:Gluconate 2-dehydrogenase subunit 3 family protein n=1 Tax=Haloterrigena alkaliphila TaxID=2816475 RepID=A0A8A2VCY7_9EURY|nr:gluconate 2-dehydrogenase subunit 3 family protein [Haloterrigena alkaliphila]QSW99913.1 gluconate 2-dehydrogenase subunit 3 family protein [Haloterrigena alkaliphila]